MQALSDTNCVPRFYAMGQYERRDYIVMELLTGEDMTSLRNRVRNANPTGLVPLPVVVHLACEIVNCLQDMHRKGYVHRDVKPSNFVRKSAEGTKFCAIDFGLVKQVRRPLPSPSPPCAPCPGPCPRLTPMLPVPQYRRHGQGQEGSR